LETLLAVANPGPVAFLESLISINVSLGALHGKPVEALCRAKSRPKN